MEENADVRRSWWRRSLRIVNSLVWVIVALIIIPQACGTHWTDRARTKLLERFQSERKSRVIAMIHRQETVSVLGVPVSNFIDIEDSEEILRAIRATPNDQPIDLILHTPGGLVLAAEQIAKALVDHKGKITVFVPHYAMSGGTLIALAADEIVMDSNAVLGPVDPQIGDMPAASIVKILDFKKPSQVGDEMLVLIDMAAKARVQVATFVADILLKHYPKESRGDRNHFERRPLDARFSDHGRRRTATRTESVDEHAAHGLRLNGFISAGGHGPALGALCAAAPAEQRSGRSAKSNADGADILARAN